MNVFGKIYLAKGFLKVFRNGIMGIMIAVYFFGCASQAPPSGGPEDKTPPTVLFTDPLTDSVNVSRHPRIMIEFSEPMNKSSVEQSIYISPRRDKPPEYSWKKNRLTLILPDTLDTNQTCVVTIGTGAKDARQNPLSQPFTFAFSTGSKIDRGTMTGSVLHANFKGMNVWAYRIDQHVLQEPDSLVYLENADYVTSVNDQGAFQLSYLAAGKYRLYAVIDQDQDGVYTPGIDLIGLPGGDQFLTEDSNMVSGFLLHMMKEDTVKFAVGTLRAIDEQTLLLGFTIPLMKTDFSGSHDSIIRRIRIHDLSSYDSLPVYDVFLNTVNLIELKILTGKMDSTRRYMLRMERLISDKADTIPAITDTIETFDFYQPEQPVFEWILPEKGNDMVNPDERIAVRFNKGIRRKTWENEVILRADSVTIHQGKWFWTTGGYAEYVHDSLYQSDKKYEFIITPGTVTDWQGISLTDTMIRLAFQSYPADSLGTVGGDFFSVFSGDSLFYNLTLRNLLQEKREYRKTIRNGQPFRFDYVIPGKYVLEAFLDRNGDQLFNKGRVAPFEPPEPFRMYQDTVSVRANWETSGITFNFK